MCKVNRKNSLLETIDEMENNFKYEEAQINNDLLKQVIEYNFPISYEVNFLYRVFAFDLETCKFENSEYCEPYAAGVYHLNTLFEYFNGNLNEKQLAIERSKINVFDREKGNAVVKMIEYVINNHKGKTNYITNKHGKRIVSSNKNQMGDHNASGFDNYIVLKSLPSSYKCMKRIKTSRRKTKTSFKAGSVIENDVEIPKYMNFVCSKCHISGSLKEIQK